MAIKITNNLQINKTEITYSCVRCSIEERIINFYPQHVKSFHLIFVILAVQAILNGPRLLTTA